MRRIIWTATLLLGAPVGVLRAQVTPIGATLRADQRVRVVTQLPWCPHTECAPQQMRRMFVGALGSLDADSIAVETDREPVRLPLAVVSRVDTFTGRKKPLVRGAVEGFAIGALVGAPLGAALGNWCLFDPCDTHPVHEAAVVGLRTGAIGALLGFLIARGSSGEHWRAALTHDPDAGLVPISRALGPTIHLAVGPLWDPGGLGLQARLTF